MNGTKLGDYEILRLIGRGGMGAVYEAINSVINRRAAIKLLLPEYAEREDVVRRFFNEARAVNAINHPGVVQVSEVGKAPDGSLYLVMEYLEGETLSDRLAHSRGKLTEEEAITISWQLAGVLAAAHAKSIVHRDVKPGNVMLVPDMAGPSGERIKLLDFGIAKLGAEHFQGEAVRTRTGQVMGTASYMSPEQFQGEKPVDGQSDVYSLGVVMYRLLAGRLPFVSQSGEMAIAAMHMFQAPQPLSTIAPGVSPWLHSLVDSMLSKESKDRPTMQQVTAMLHEYLPFRSTSRSNLTPVASSLSSSSHLRLSSVEPTIDAAGLAPTGNAPIGGLPSSSSMKSPSALDIKIENSPASSSQPGTITRATGQLSVSTIRKVMIKRRTLLALAGGSLLLACIGGALVLRALSGSTTTPAMKTPPVITQPSAPDKGATAGPSAPPTAEPATKPHGPNNGSDADTGPAPPGKIDLLTGEPIHDKSGRRGHKTDGRRDGKPRTSHKPQSTQIIN